MNYVEILRKDLYPFVSTWISIEKTEQYKEFVLDFLRSFLSTVRSNRKFVTNHKEQFNTFKNTDKFTPHAPYLLNKPEKYEERIPTIEEMRARLNLDKLPETQSQENDKAQSFHEVRKYGPVQGKNIIKGIYNTSTVSNYQETFK